MAVPYVAESLTAAQGLAARLQVEAGGRVVQRVLDADVHATHRVHHAHQPAEPDFHVMVDAKARVVLHGLREQRGPAEGEGSVELVLAVSRYDHVEVTRQAHQSGLT